MQGKKNERKNSMNSVVVSLLTSTLRHFIILTMFTFQSQNAANEWRCKQNLY